MRRLDNFSDSVSGRSWSVRFCLVMLAVWHTASSLLSAAPCCAASGQPAPVKVKKETSAAFDRYVQTVEARNAEELRREDSFLWIDGSPENERGAAYAALKEGTAKIKRIEARENGAVLETPGAMIHHWVGAIYVRGAKLSDVLAILEDYDHQSTYYAPDVERSKIESHDGDRYKVFLRFRRHKVITVVLNSEHEVQYFHDSSTRAHSRSSAVRIVEVENPGKEDEREKTPGDDGGFLWRMETWWRMEERDSGVYVQSEAVSLTRDIPTGLGWLIGPFVTSIPKESLSFTLESTRKAVLARRNSKASAVETPK